MEQVTSSAGFHHKSIRITLLHAVKFNPAKMTCQLGGLKKYCYLPVLPALKEIKMTLVLRLVLILFNEASLSFWDIDPSSN